MTENANLKVNHNTETGPSQVATFKVGSMLFGIDVAVVQEVIRFQRMTPVPLGPTVVKGLINLRGQIITALDLREALNMEPLEPDRAPMNVVVRTENDHLSILVDKIEDVLNLDYSRLETTPETVEESYQDLLQSVYKLERGLLLILNAERMAKFSNEF
jgi:purine-binding chemotaxis protein CheW